MRTAIYTLGCKVNQYETQAMERLLQARGHEIVPWGQEADVYVVNSCSVTAVSDQKSRQTVHRLLRTYPEALVALCGCYTQTHPEEARTLGVHLLAGSGDREGFVDLLEQAWRERQEARDFSRALESLDRPFDRRAFEILPAGGLEGRTRAMLKVEDGCVNFCTYCIIPYARGPVRSLPLEAAAAQAAELAAAGYREIVLTGIEISSWGRDLAGRPGLAELIETVSAAAPAVRIRLGSLEPRTVTREFCRRCAAVPNLCPQFHLSLQSGCDATLARMHRKYTAERYLASVELLNEVFRRPAVTTDLIVGFPGETEAEFQETLAFLHRCRFARIHVFPYSVRPGTPAAAMEQVPQGIKEERARRAGAAAAELRRQYLEDCVGEVYPVLFEEPRGERYFGHAPNYTEVLAGTAEMALHNTLRQVRITGVLGEALQGELLEESAEN